MRVFALFVMFLAAFGMNANAATTGQRRGGTTTATSSGSASSARSAVSARAAARPNAPATANTSQPVAARAATRNTATRGPAPSAQTTTVGARAATTQKVISTGTKVAAATQNTVVSEECRLKYDGCMDSFCMLDNTSGGRCTCSDKNAELNNILAEIEKLDQQSYQMATFGVEKIEMGADAEQAIANANAAAQSVINQEGEAKKKGSRKKLDLSAWNTVVDFESDDIFEDTNILQSTIDDKEGDALHRAAAQLCAQQMPECSADLSMLQMMYAQKIRSDCSAYENSLKQQKNASAQKLYAAEQALREAALEQLHIANKYDLGQCTIEFKKCMVTTGGCGEDFSNCASVAAMDNTNTRKSTKNVQKTYAIKGSATTIEIFASTYDVLEGKKPLCMGITESCVAVKDKVWDTFLREIAPQIKSAELIAEDKARQECIGNISTCFQNACKDTMDPNDPDGSYDMCLSRPETMLNVCKIPLNACGIGEGNQTITKNIAEQSQIWQFVVARLASMRVDACTKEVKTCLTSDDRCGKDYSQCVGLDTDTIIHMCPYEKLTGCVETYGAAQVTSNEVYDKLADMVQGIMLNIDNNFLTQCQNAANEAMIKVCGDTENCNSLAVDDNIGARSLEYKICEVENGVASGKCYNNISQIPDSDLGRAANGTTIAPKQFQAKINGQIAWELLDFDGKDFLNIDNAIEKYALKNTSGTRQVFKNEQEKAVYEANMKAEADRVQAENDKIKSELAVVTNSIKMAVDAIESDATVEFCMTGREVQGVRKSTDSATTRATFGAKGDDQGRFGSLTSQMRLTIANAAIAVARQNYYKKYDSISTDIAKDMMDLAERIAKNQGQNELDARREIARQSCTGYAKASAIGTGGTDKGNGQQIDYVGSASVNERSYKETTTSTFNPETLVCHRCIRKQACAKMKGKNCRTWGEESETCNDIQF